MYNSLFNLYDSNIGFAYTEFGVNLLGEPHVSQNEHDDKNS